MENKINFLSWRLTPGEKTIGIAEVLVNGIILRHKVLPGKEGKGYYITCAAYPVKDDQGHLKYLNAFAGSTDELRKAIDKCIREKIST